MTHNKTAINKYCPRSGKSVLPDSLTQYLGYTIGFCNPVCRDDFHEHSADRPKDRAYFDLLIKEQI